MEFVRGLPREQAVLFPETLDDYVGEDNPVRFIDAFVDHLDLRGLGFERTEPAFTGRPPFDPRDLLKLYIYGYLNQVRSSRKLEREAYRNVEVMWLLRKLRPDHKTISDFRKDNRKAFKGVFREFSVLCRKLKLFGGELVAVDGSKFKAVNSSRRNFTKQKLQDRLREIDEKIESYLQELDEADAQAVPDPVPSKEALQDKIEMLQDRKATYTQLMEDLEASGEKQVSLTDPDSRSMPKSPKAKVGYNAQIGVDDKHKLIVAQDVTNAVNDADQLSKISIQAKETLDVGYLKVVADTAYNNGEEIKVCEAEGIEPYVAKRFTSSCASKGLYGKDQFRYDPEKDCYFCPAGEMLTYRWTARRGSKGSAAKHFLRHYATATCKTCRLKSRCTTNKKGRRIARWVDEHIIERMETRVAANPELMKKRNQIVEHPFGTIKFWNDQGHFLVRGLEKVKAELSLMTLAYNIKRVIHLLGVPRLIEVLALQKGYWMFLYCPKRCA